ncbi:tetratricopeptide repeat protein [Actinomadura sp. WMMA1423]|uniref:tetratricopeptide repeat protein n=1 Tax=Actinomadura sp. WMMA1423 TaxID=2591108 RepID=UPI0011475360|nr:tetratricopeptide repeat protein [Actinomadura sp. WMMA1423]
MTNPPTPPADGPPPHLSGIASGHGAVNQAGRDQYVIEGQVVLAAGLPRPAEVTAAPALANVPAHAHLFVGRGSELEELDAALSESAEVVVAAVHGLGGVGKSTLAARYGDRHRDRFSPVWWITADTREAVRAGLAALAVALQPELKQALPLDALAEWALTWLSCHDGWLLVLDNVNDPEHIAPVMARTGTGRVLVTSRLGEGWHRFGAQVLRLDVLTSGQAVELLTRIAAHDRPGADLDGAAELATELGCLPLAIEQAAAYLHQHRLSPRAYLELLADSPAVMYDQTAQGADAQRTIARIWRLTLDQLTDAPLAGDLLRVLAWYAPEAIPCALLDDLATVMTDSARTPPRDRRRPWPKRRPGTDPPIPPTVPRQALGVLAAYNMVTLGEDGDVTVHRLVQALARTSDPADPHRQPDAIAAARDTATRLLHQARPLDVEDPAGWPMWRTLLPHIDALADHAPATTDTDTMWHLLDRAATFLQLQGSPTRAIAYFQRALATNHRLHGDQALSVLISRNNLALAYQITADRERAIALHEQTLADAERVLGSDHPRTLVFRHNLAGAYRAAGDLERALPLHEQTVADAERVLGSDHPNTLTSRNDLAGAYRTAGDLERAIALHEQTLADRERVLGSDHPHTLVSRHNLAGAYRAAGDLERALPLHEQTLADAERVLGSDHPNTLTSRNNLALAYQAAGDLERAIALHEQTLADRERVLGSDHPHTLNSRNNLAMARRAAQDSR